MENCTVRHCGTTNDPNVFSTNDSVAMFEMEDMPLVDSLKLGLEVLIALFGVVGNVLVTTVICRMGKKKKPADFYLLNLAIADLGFLFLTFPLGVIKEKMPCNWPLGEFTCLYLYPMPEIFHGSSVWCITVIAIHRYLKIVTLRPKRHSSRKTSLRNSKIIIGFIWVISFFVFCLPLHFVVQYHELSNGLTTCDPVWPSWDRSWILPRLYVGLMTFFSYILPLFLIAVTYIKIGHKINCSSKFIKDMKIQHSVISTDDGKVVSLSRMELQRLHQNRRIKKILTPVVVVFAITMLPLSMLRIAIIWWPVIATQTYYEHLLFVVVVFVEINSSSNPLIYSLVSKDFRKRLKELFCKGRDESCNLL